MNPLIIDSYAQDIALYVPFKPVEALLSANEKEETVDSLLMSLNPVIERFGSIQAEHYPEKRRLLHAALNVLEPNFLAVGEIAELDSLLQTELHERPIISGSEMAQSAALDVRGTKISPWQGDITTLKVDAIVNAANNRLLGCFQPLHGCIDNAIHTRAGVQLRDDCHTIVQKQAMPEPTGVAKITRGYNLPARFVLHTVGPIVQGALTPQLEADLQRAYLSCLDLAAKVDEVRSVAFCCISTGEFGYPQQQAAETALSTVQTWLEQNSGQLDHVIFNVFTDRDLAIYQSLLG